MHRVHVGAVSGPCMDLGSLSLDERENFVQLLLAVDVLVVTEVVGLALQLVW